MSEQFLLERPRAKTPPRKSRLFFAVQLQGAVAEEAGQLARIQRSLHGLSGRPLLTDRFHITLPFLETFTDVPPMLVKLAIKAAETIDLPAFDAAFDHVASFDHKPFNRPLVMLGGEGVAGLIALHDALDVALDAVGLPWPPNPDFTPHVTLLYDDRAVAEHPIEPVRWTVRDFVLIESLQGLTRHVPLGRWRLRDC